MAVIGPEEAPLEELAARLLAEVSRCAPVGRELIVQRTESVGAEAEPATRELLASEGTATRVLARGGGLPETTAWIRSLDEIPGLLTGAAGAPGPSGRLRAHAVEVDTARARMRGLLDEVSRHSRLVQAALYSRTEVSTLSIRDGEARTRRVVRELAMVRCETAQGAVLESVESVDGAWDATEALHRLDDALETLEGSGGALDPALPVALRPAVAAPLVAAIGWLFRADTAATIANWPRALGRRIFPQSLTVRDRPWTPLDDEGSASQELTLIDRGLVTTFLHDRESARASGTAPNGRGFLGETGLAPGATRLLVEGGAQELPPDCIELNARLENFTTMRRPGLVSISAAGWLRRAGRRVERVGPVELELPLLPTLRRIVAVCGRAERIPAFDSLECPTLLVHPLPRPDERA